MTYALIRSATRAARKNHRCIWCGESIPVGLSHRYEVSKFDGDLQIHRWHSECSEAAQDYFNSGVGPDFSCYENERPAQGAAVKLGSSGGGVEREAV